MTSKQELTIETLQVEIRVICVGGHKMTAAVFDQLRQRSFYNLIAGYGLVAEDLYLAGREIEAIEILEELIDSDSIDVKGYVYRNRCYWLFYSENGSLYKTKLHSGDYETRWGWDYIVPRVQARFSQLFIAT